MANPKEIMEGALASGPVQGVKDAGAAVGSAVKKGAAAVGGAVKSVGEDIGTMKKLWKDRSTIADEYYKSKK